MRVALLKSVNSKREEQEMTTLRAFAIAILFTFNPMLGTTAIHLDLAGSTNPDTGTVELAVK